MNVPTIEMDPAIAKEHWLEYRAAVKEQNREDDRDIAAGYKALADGKKIIDIHEAFRATGLDDKHRPKLAIARADAQWCWLRSQGNGTIRFQIREHVNYRDSRRYIDIPRGVLPAEAGNFGWNNRAIVPSIPPRLRPKAAYENFHILWEAEWEKAPTDPLLLRHLSGSLYVVLACWDLTELERSVLGRAMTR